MMFKKDAILPLKYVILKWNTYLLPMPFSSQSSIRKSQRKEDKYIQLQIHPSRHKSASKPPHWGRTWIEQQPNMILLLHLCKLVYIQTYSPMERSTSPYVHTYIQDYVMAVDRRPKKCVWEVVDD